MSCRYFALIPLIVYLLCSFTNSSIKCVTRYRDSGSSSSFVKPHFVDSNQYIDKIEVDVLLCVDYEKTVSDGKRSFELKLEIQTAKFVNNSINYSSNVNFDSSNFETGFTVACDLAADKAVNDNIIIYDVQNEHSNLSINVKPVQSDNSDILNFDNIPELVRLQTEDQCLANVYGKIGQTEVQKYGVSTFKLSILTLKAWLDHWLTNLVVFNGKKHPITRSIYAML